MSDWFAIRTQAQRDVHAAFAVRGQYSDATLETAVDLSVRWHSRFGLPVGGIGGSDYAGVLETIDRLVFNRAELIEAGLTMRRGGKVLLLDYEYTFTLDVREPNAGVVNEVWTVSN